MNKILNWNTHRNEGSANRPAEKKPSAQTHDNLRTELEDYVEFSQMFDRHFMARVKPSEYMVLRFILDRTLGWNKVIERVSLKQMMGGNRVKKDNCEGTFHGTGLSRRCLIDTTETLVADGILARERMGTGAFRYAIHLGNLEAFIELRDRRKMEK